MPVAARARGVSARTGGQILCQLLFDAIRVGGKLDRVLNGPTSEAWIHPWENHLRSLGVTLRNKCRVAGLSCDGRRITGAAVTTSTGTEVVTADFYVAALQIAIPDTPTRMRWLSSAGLLSWGWAQVGQNHAPVRARPGRMVVPRWDPSGSR
jgi:uncharacterized protein with NAD-binding domain and iron-sulfur cluster